MAEGLEADFWDAIKAGDRARVEQLAAQAPELLARRTAEGLSPAMLAMYYREPALAEWLADRGEELSIFEAAALGRAGRVAACLQQDPEQAAAFAQDGFTALGLAAYFGRLHVIDVLLQSNGDPDTPSRNALHVTPLQSAVSGGHVEVVRRLLAAGANPNVREAGGFTPLHAAAQNGQLDMVELLLQHGARQSPADNGHTPLDLAQSGGHTTVVQMLSESA